MLNVCILGGLGYIGSHLLELLVPRQDIRIKVLDLELFGKDHVEHILQLSNVEYFRGNICNAADLSKVIRGSDVVIHLAGLVGDPACSIDKEITWLCNEQSSKIISSICNHYCVPFLIFVSTCSVYGASFSSDLLDEESKLNPVSLYAETKIISEDIFLSSFEGKCSILRFATVFGLSKRMRFDLVANLFTIKAVKEGRFQVFGGTQYRPFLHCHDAARSILTLLGSDWSLVDREIFNVSCENVAIRDLAILVRESLPNTLVEFISKKEDRRNYCVSSKKVKEVLGFEPLISLKEGIEEMGNKFLSSFNDWKSPKYYNHLVEIT